ncbi:MAG: DNA repair protein RadC [Bacteroidota bacterium]|nr:DNA repair protein RadC [Bacteroidota bacterium]
MTAKEIKMDLKRITGNVKNITWKFRDAKYLSYFYPEMDSSKKIASPSDVFNMFQKMFYCETKEIFTVLWLNTNNKPVGFETVSVGNLNSSIVHPREVFRSAIVSSCANIILIHNHPSGNPEPSNEDIKVTEKLICAGKIIDINVFDHIIIAGGTYCSFVERHLI